MQRRRWKVVLRKPTADRAQERPVMKIQMRPVGEKLDSAVSRFSYRFQEINRHSPASMDLRRDSELHEGIVQERNVMMMAMFVLTLLLAMPAMFQNTNVTVQPDM